MPLEEAMQQYEAGLNALNALEKELTAAQQRLTVLRQQSGEDIEVPLTFVDDAGVEPVVGSITIRVSPTKKR